MRSSSIAGSVIAYLGELEVKESSMDYTDSYTGLPGNEWMPVAAPVVRVAASRRRSAISIRLTLASELGSDLDGAWWPHSSSLARELPELIDALREPLGQVIDISVNWTSLQGVPDLDLLTCRGIEAIADRRPRHQRLMTVTGSRARANLLVVPSRTSTALAVMVLRRAAALPILPTHLDTPACRRADNIVQAARAERAPIATPANTH